MPGDAGQSTLLHGGELARLKKRVCEYLNANAGSDDRSGCNDMGDIDWEAFLLKAIGSVPLDSPQDVDMHIKLLDMYLRPQEPDLSVHKALRHIIAAEHRSLFSSLVDANGAVKWYKSIGELLEHAACSPLAGLENAQNRDLIRLTRLQIAVNELLDSFGDPNAGHTQRPMTLFAE
jgi:hypothetical protein